MYLNEFEIGDTVVDTSDGQELLIIEKISRDRIKAKVMKPSKRANCSRNRLNKTYVYREDYGNCFVILKPNNEGSFENTIKNKKDLTALKLDLQKAKENVEKIELAIANVHKSLALKPGTMYQSDSHFNGLRAIFMGECEGNFEFYLGGEYRGISISPDDLEKFKPMNLPNQRKMAKAVFDFLEGRIPNN